MNNRALTVFYGGTFDPIHYGHLLSIISLMQFIKLKKVIFLPNNIPPHRPKPAASAEQRLTMVKLAISEVSHSIFALDDRELFRSTPSWTIDTLKEIREEYGYNVPLGFIIGQDSLFTLPKWYLGLTLLNMCHLLVCTRCNYNSLAIIKNNYSWYKPRIVQNPSELYKLPFGLIFYAKTPTFAVSSSQIRARYRKRQSCNGLLPSKVDQYIQKERLYR